MCFVLGDENNAIRIVLSRGHDIILRSKTARVISCHVCYLQLEEVCSNVNVSYAQDNLCWIHFRFFFLSNALT